MNITNNGNQLTQKDMGIYHWMLSMGDIFSVDLWKITSAMESGQYDLARALTFECAGSYDGEFGPPGTFSGLMPTMRQGA